MKEKLRRFMAGRYGVDALSQCMLWTSLACLLLDCFFHTGILYWGGLALLIYSYVRVFSRNYTKRAAQNRWYLERTAKMRGWFQKKKRRHEMKKVYHLCRCNVCKQEIRVPKGKGKLEVTCPKCRNVFLTKS